MADEANKEQAEVCARRGIEALNKGDAATAVRFLTKSLRMYNLGTTVQSKLDEAKRILEGNNSNSSSNSNDNDSSTTSSPRTATDSPRSTTTNHSRSGHDGVRHRPGHSSSSSSSSSSSTTHNPILRPHTPEMAELVRKIKNAKTYYDVLGITNDADEDTIKKAYKKLALKIHPDKNTAPGSDEAFKRVGAACAVLTDPDKRAAYDRYGEAGADGISSNASSDREQARARYYRQHFEEEISPEDIFNMFFSGGLGGGFGGVGMTQIYRDEDGNLRAVRSGGNRNTHRHEYTQNGNNNGKAVQLLQLIPLLIFFLFSFLSFGGWDDRFFSLGRTDTFKILRKTEHPEGLSYYVRPDIEKRIKGGDKTLKRSIESEVLRDWMKACRHDNRGESCAKLYEHLYSPPTTSNSNHRQTSKTPEEDEFNNI